MTKPDPAYVAWSRNLFATITDGGAWGIPRSGLIFRKRGQRLELTDRMPHDPDMPVTAAQLREQQDRELAVVAATFGAAGIAVVDNTTERT